MVITTLDFSGKNEEGKLYRCEGVLLEPNKDNNSAKMFLRLKPKELTDVRFRLLNEKIEKLNKEIFERKCAVEKNKQLYIQAREASRLKDEFLATISHELRTPLNSILGWIGIIKSTEFDTNLFEKAFETIERNANAQVKLIEDILDVSRIITGKLKLNTQPVELSLIVETAVDSVRPMAENKEISLQTFFDSNINIISGDEERIQQIVWNLLTNALKFTNKGGHVEVKLQNLGSHIEIIVSDTGEGISSEFLPFVFERFLQADASKTRTHGGLGLGLAIVRHLTELHGGRVEAQSEGAGKGSTFTVTLPLNVPEDEYFYDETINQLHSTDSEPISDLNYTLLENLHLLIVDDESDSSEFLKIILEKYKVKVETASSAAEAFEKVSENNFDILISDIAMPDEDGYSLIKKIRTSTQNSYKKIPVIAMTAYTRKEDRRQALSSGFDSYISKPFNPSELIKIITEITDRTKTDPPKDQ